MGDLPWPGGAQCAVAITIDFDGESRDLAESPTGNLWGRYSYGRYGVRAGVERLLRLLRQHDIRATWFVGGWDAEQYPERIHQIADDGHEIAAHGYLHEDFSKLAYAEARQVLERAHEAIARAAGREPVGWRAPGGVLSWDTLRALRDLGYRYESSFLDDDVPYRHVLDGQPTDLIELPQHAILDDGPQYLAYRLPHQVLQAWREEFDGIYAEGVYFSLKLHPRGTNGSGRAVRIAAVDELLAYIKRHPRLWFATCAEVADWARGQLGER